MDEERQKVGWGERIGLLEVRGPNDERPVFGLLPFKVDTPLGVAMIAAAREQNGRGSGWCGRREKKEKLGLGREISRCRVAGVSREGKGHLRACSNKFTTAGTIPTARLPPIPHFLGCSANQRSSFANAQSRRARSETSPKASVQCTILRS